MSTSRHWHWPRLPRLSRHSHAERAAKKAAAKFRAEAKLRATRGARFGGGGRERHRQEGSGGRFLLRLLAPPQFLLQVLRVLTQSAAQVRGCHCTAPHDVSPPSHDA